MRAWNVISVTARQRGCSPPRRGLGCTVYNVSLLLWPSSIQQIRQISSTVSDTDALVARVRTANLTRYSREAPRPEPVDDCKRYVRPVRRHRVVSRIAAALVASSVSGPFQDPHAITEFFNAHLSAYLHDTGPLSTPSRSRRT